MSVNNTVTCCARLQESFRSENLFGKGASGVGRGEVNSMQRRFESATLHTGRRIYFRRICSSASRAHRSSRAPHSPQNFTAEGFSCLAARQSYFRSILERANYINTTERQATSETKSKIEYRKRPRGPKQTRDKTNLKSGKSKTPNPNEVCFEFYIF